MNFTRNDWIALGFIVLGVGLALLLRKYWPVCLLITVGQGFKVAQAIRTGEIKSTLGLSRYIQSAYTQEESPGMFMVAMAFEGLLCLVFFIATMVTL